MNIWHKQFIELEKAQDNSLTTGYERDWGILYCDEQNPTYYDANHAHVELPLAHPETVISEVISFYEQRNLIPRLYVKNVEADPLFISLVQERGFMYEEFEDILQIWTGEIIPIETNEHIHIEKVTDKNEQDACEVMCGAPEMGGAELRRRAFENERKNSAYQHYVLYVAGEPASTACMIQHQDTVMLENVATLPRFRGKGLIRHLIVYMQRDLLERGVHILFVSPITEQVERVYERCGFQTLGAKVKSGHAFRGGKSIAEVRDQS